VFEEPAPEGDWSQLVVCFLEPGETSVDVRRRLSPIGLYIPTPQEDEEQRALVRERAEERSLKEDDADLDTEEDWRQFQENLDRNRRDSGGTRMISPHRDEGYVEMEPAFVEGTLRDGSIVVLEMPENVADARVLVAFVPRRSMSSQQVADLRWRFGQVVEDWYSRIKGLER
jgi:hypothetical protein